MFQSNLDTYVAMESLFYQLLLIRFIFAVPKNSLILRFYGNKIIKEKK